MRTLEFPAIKTQGDLLALLDASDLARRHFLGKATPRWLEWFQRNGFFDALKDGGMIVPDDAPDPPELGYLFRVAPERPREVADIVCGFEVNKADFDGRAVGSLLWVSSRLPAAELARIAPKVRDEGWARILDEAGTAMFGYHGILTTLHDAGDDENLLALAEAMLALRPQENLERRWSGDQNPFCLSDLSRGSLFPCLVAVGDEHVGRALSLVLRTFGGVVERRGAKAEDTTFGLFDNYFLADADLFNAETVDSRKASQDNDAHNLAGALRLLTDRFVGQPQSDPGMLAKFSAESIDTLPDSWAAWRARLFFWGSAPEVFRTELLQALRRVFAHGNVPELVAGAEYLHALGQGFRALSDGDRRDFVGQSLGLARSGRHGALVGRMLSMIHGHLTPGEAKAAKDLGLAIDPHFSPEPMIGQLGREPGAARRPMHQDGLARFSVPDIVTQLRTAWRPDALEKSGNGSRRNTDAYGVGCMLERDVQDRPAEYARHARLLFDGDTLDPHYTCTCLEELRQAIRDKPEARSQVDGDAIVDCCLAITRSDKAGSLGRNPRTGRDGPVPLLLGWSSVLFAAAAIVRETLYGKNGSMLVKSRRNDILDIVSHLLSASDPIPGDEGSATSPPGGVASQGTTWKDPVGVAINSCRGIAFEALVLLARQEAGLLEAEGKGKLARDIRDLFVDTLGRTDTRAIMSMYGRHFLSLRELDKRWGMGLLARIFPEDPGKRHLFEAAWAGYLCRTPPPSFQSDKRTQGLYLRATRMLDTVEPGGRQFEELGEGLARQLAFFFVRCHEFDAGHPVFDSLWHEGVPGLRASFVERVGKMVFGENADRDGGLGRKSRELWENALGEKQPPEVLMRFGHWVNPGSEVINTADLAQLVRRTLQATGGELPWASGLEHSIKALAKASPEDTVEIVRHHLRWLARQDSIYRPTLDPDNVWHQAIKTFFEVPSLEEKARALVDELIVADSQKFGPIRQALPKPSPPARPGSAKVRTSSPRREGAARDSVAVAERRPRRGSRRSEPEGLVAKSGVHRGSRPGSRSGPG